ncbi:MAG: restriction endonuclease subunit S [Bacteroidales bacterium]|nr:restriction endonuclease subunit S [Bacteroidales bacterium]
MKEDWKECKLGDVVEINQNSFSEKENWLFVNYLDTGSITENKISEIQYINLIDEKLPSRAKRKVKKNSIIYSTVRPNQNHFGIIKSFPENFLVSTGFAVLDVNKKIAFPDFVYYYLIQNENTESLHAIAEQTTSAYPAIKPSDIADISIILPPLATQQKIAQILSSLDDKIELNNKINDNLEQQAQAIFKSWFVDFEPFGGKMPEGWRVGKLSEIGTIVGGSTPSKAKSEYYAKKGIAWITPKDLSNDKSKFISHGEIDITEQGFKNCSAIKMPKGTILYSSRAPIGYIAIAKNELTTNQGFKSVIPNDDIGNAYIYYFLKSNFDLIDSMASGSTFKEISGTAMKNIPILIPDEKTLLEFQSFSSGIFDEQEKLEEENQKLASLRDTLLPKLMSGEIEVNSVQV